MKNEDITEVYNDYNAKKIYTKTGEFRRPNAGEFILCEHPPKKFVCEAKHDGYKQEYYIMVEVEELPRRYIVKEYDQDNITDRLYKALKSAKESYDLTIAEVPLPLLAIGVVQGCFVTVDWIAIEEYEKQNKEKDVSDK